MLPPISRYSASPFTPAWDGGSTPPSAPFTDCFLIRISPKEYLTDYTDTLGLCINTDLNKAKLFFNDSRALHIAHLFSGTVLGAIYYPRTREVKLCARHVAFQFHIPLEPSDEQVERIKTGVLSHTLQTMVALLVQNAGGLPQGLQSGFAHIPALALFTHPGLPQHQRSTVAVPLPELSSERVELELTRLHRKFTEAQ